ncbi:unnamed protein product [Effrenium voratum]|nr:unnamed protein product [Effrenium voratum]CAJ1422867.1 unnamed protein product [Effrenium voratum]
MARREHSPSKGILAAFLAAFWTASLAGAFVSAGLKPSRDQSLMTRSSGRDWHAGNVLKKVDFTAAAAQAQARAAKKKKDAAAGKDKERPQPPKIFKKSPVYYNGEQVSAVNGTLGEYKVDIWSGVHPAWQGRKGKVLMDNSALTKFQEKFGHAAAVYGDQGMEQVKANKELKKKQEEMAKQGLKVY